MNLWLQPLELMDLHGDGNEFDDSEKNLTRAWLRTKGNSIEGGTSEVQLNVISKRVLELPSLSLIHI